VRIDDEIEAAVELGIRFHATRGSMSLGESRGGLPPDSLVEDEGVILRDSRRAVEQFHQVKRFGMVSVALAPCSPFSVTADLMRESAALARAYGVRLLRRPSTRSVSVWSSSARAPWIMSSPLGGWGLTSGTRTVST
jgi:cytosine/adenosine deaminase-related metal-dependent hydrolase